MLNSSASRAVIVVLTVALVGVLGFASGFLTCSVLARLAPDPTPAPTLSDEAVQVQPESTMLPQGGPTEPAGDTPTAPPSAAETAAPAEPATPPPLPTLSANEREAFELFWEAWDIIRGEYYGDIPNSEEMTYGAIRGAIGALDDPYTGFIEPSVANILRQDQSGSFEGIGALVTMEEGVLMIVSVYEDQPADRAGIRAGDIVLQVDDTEIQNMSLYEAVALIRGPEGSTVRLTIQRDAEEPFEVEVTRARIEIQLVDSEMREDGIAYVSLFQFDPNATSALGDAIEGLLSQNPEGLILDLRGNPGGLLQEAILTPGLFLPRETLVLIERFKDGSETPYRTMQEPIAPDIPLVVLVDEGSASASEIVAGALQDHGRAMLIGQRTFGKGSVQLVHELSNGAELRVTVARWFTPNDRAIHGEGLEPDIAVEMTHADVEAGRDPQLERAVEYLLTGQ